jgi:putative copper export protein
MTPDALSVVVQALAFMALFQAAGIGFFLASFGHRLTGAREPTRRRGLIAAAMGLILILTHVGLDAARMAGDFSGTLDLDLQQLAWVSKSGASQLVQVVGLLVILVALWRPARIRTRWASVGGVIAVGGFLLTGHTSTHALRSVLAPLLALHLLVVAFWFGALLPLTFVIRVESRAIAAQVIRAFSRIASLLVPLILLAGITIAWLLTGSLAVLRKPYGQLLIAKAIGFALLMLLATYNKWRLTPALAEGRSGSALRRSIIAEYMLIAAVMSVTAVLTTFYSPNLETTTPSWFAVFPSCTGTRSETEPTHFHSITTAPHTAHLEIPLNQVVGGSLGSVSSDAPVVAFRGHKLSGDGVAYSIIGNVQLPKNGTATSRLSAIDAKRGKFCYRFAVLLQVGRQSE